MISNICCYTNNPYNIRYSKSNFWLGLIGNYKGFAVFDNINFAVRAAIKILHSYIDRGYNTPSSIINRWAPSVENNVCNYCTYISLHIPLDKVIVYKSDDFFTLMVDMSYYETGFRLDKDYLSYIINRFKL